MRIATLIVGIVFSFALFFQSRVADFGSALSSSEELGAAAAVGTLGALIWLIASALVIPFPLVSTILFGLASLVMIGGGSAYSEHYPDLQYWGWFGLVFVGSSFLGWRGKKKADAEKREEKERQQKRDQMLEQMIRQQSVSAPAAPHQQSGKKAIDAQDVSSRPKWMS